MRIEVFAKLAVSCGHIPLAGINAADGYFPEAAAAFDEHESLSSVPAHKDDIVVLFHCDHLFDGDGDLPERVAFLGGRIVEFFETGENISVPFQSDLPFQDLFPVEIGMGGRAVERVLFHVGSPLINQAQTVIRVIGMEPEDEDRGIRHGFARGFQDAGKLPELDLALVVPLKVELHVFCRFRLPVQRNTDQFRSPGIGEIADRPCSVSHIVVQHPFRQLIQRRAGAFFSQYDAHVVLFQRVHVIVREAESPAELVSLRVISVLAEVQLDPVVSQFPDVEFAIDGTPFGLRFIIHVIPARIAVPGDKLHIVQRLAVFVHDGPVQRSLHRGKFASVIEESPDVDTCRASGRPDGAEGHGAERGCDQKYSVFHVFSPWNWCC